MIKVNIKRENKVTNSGIFENIKKANEWLDVCKSKNKFGKNQSETKIDAVLDDNGNVLEPERIEVTPAEYAVEIIDITEEVLARIEAKKTRKLDLENIKWNEVNTIAEVKQILKLIVDELDENNR